MRSPLRSLLLTALITLGATIGVIFIAWIALISFSDAIQWTEISKRFEDVLAICRALLYSALAIAWIATRKRAPGSSRRRLIDRTGMAGFAGIVLVELNRIQG